MTAPDPKAADAVRAAANAAGAVDDDAIAAMVDLGAVTLPAIGQGSNAHELVAALKAQRPHLFKPSIREMTPAEYQAAKVGLLRDARAKQREIDAANTLERIEKRYQK
jgi:hypothetical protein